MTINIGKKAGITLAIIGLIAVVYNVIFFVVPWNNGMSVAATWITYGCTWLALIFGGVVTAVAFNKKELKSRIFGIPVHCVGYTVLLLQLLIDGVVMGVGHWFEIAFWIPTIVEVLLFALATITVIVRAANRDFIESIDKKEVKEAYIKQLRIEVDSLVEANTIDAINADLVKLAETVRYTDPVSHKNVEDTEDQITVAFEELEKAVAEGDVAKAQSSIAKMNRLLNERKAILKNAR